MSKSPYVVCACLSHFMFWVTICLGCTVSKSFYVLCHYILGVCPSHFMFWVYAQVSLCLGCMPKSCYVLGVCLSHFMFWVYSQMTMSSWVHVQVMLWFECMPKSLYDLGVCPQVTFCLGCMSASHFMSGMSSQGSLCLVYMSVTLCLECVTKPLYVLGTLLKSSRVRRYAQAASRLDCKRWLGIIIIWKQLARMFAVSLTSWL